MAESCQTNCDALRAPLRDSNMADTAWKKFRDKVTAKRGKKGDAGDTTQNYLKELTVQRLSSEVSGKAQKYARIGLWEFVPFTEDELTIENIEHCCERNFAMQVGTSLVCKILTGEQGPSCKTRYQIPGMKVHVIYVRFVTGIKHPRLCTRVAVSIKHGLRTMDYGLGIKHGLRYKTQRTKLTRTSFCKYQFCTYYM